MAGVLISRMVPGVRDQQQHRMEATVAHAWRASCIGANADGAHDELATADAPISTHHALSISANVVHNMVEQNKSEKRHRNAGAGMPACHDQCLDQQQPRVPA